MKKLALVSVLLVGLFMSCSNDDDSISCAYQVQLILENYTPQLQALLPPSSPEYDYSFDYEPFYALVAQRDLEIEALGCN